MNHLTKLTDFSAPIYELIFRSFWLGHEGDFRQRLIELMDLTGKNQLGDINLSQKVCVMWSMGCFLRDVWRRV